MVKNFRANRIIWTPIRPYAKICGVRVELRSPNITAAVKETAGQIVTYNNKQIITPYFNQSDGRTRSAKKFGDGTTRRIWRRTGRFLRSIELKGHGVGLSGVGRQN